MSDKKYVKRKISYCLKCEKTKNENIIEAELEKIG